ncbi:MAG: 50S ribosome-binding GTPase, partial [Oscillospiraceae bacterium]|nr:50S ribosome-binding GTPase [Oscillospiraceae bacterium]
MNFNNVEFLISAAAPKDFPGSRLPEIAFAGKSNVGKSSVINRVLLRKNFARVGEKPGKTIHVNYFVVDKTCYFVD